MSNRPSVVHYSDSYRPAHARGYPPPPLCGGYPAFPGGRYPRPAPSAGALPTTGYTPWVLRVGASIIDTIPLAIIIGIGAASLAGTRETACVVTTEPVGQVCASGTTVVGKLLLFLTCCVGLAYVIWNSCYRQGVTGSSIGKSVLKFRVVSEKTGQPIGFASSVVRQLAHITDTLTGSIGYLFPLWDAKRQTLADKIMTTVCVPV
jgi:uncharacterized RDD family membrane protein YckC